MNNLFKVILLCAILSNTFTPCFSNETKTLTDSEPLQPRFTSDAFEDAFTPTTLTNDTAEALAELPIAEPVELVNNDDKEVLEKLETKTSDFIYDERLDFLPAVQSNVASLDKDENKDKNITLIEDNRIASCPIKNDILMNRVGTVDAFKHAYKCLDGKELDAIVLEKGKTFNVKSLKPMSFESATGTKVEFESIYDERIFLSKEPSKLLFKGEVIKNKPPRKGGGSGTLKVKLTGLQVENVTYPIEAYISKMNKKGVLFGAVAGPSRYRDNLANTVNKGTINNYYNYDPCNVVAHECVSNAVKPFYFITGAALQTADLLLAPMVAFFAKGNEVYIPEGTEFEIKLEEAVPVLEL